MDVPIKQELVVEDINFATCNKYDQQNLDESNESSSSGQQLEEYPLEILKKVDDINEETSHDRHVTLKDIEHIHIKEELKDEETDDLIHSLSDGSAEKTLSSNRRTRDGKSNKDDFSGGPQPSEILSYDCPMQDNVINSEDSILCTVRNIINGMISSTNSCGEPMNQFDPNIILPPPEEFNSDKTDNSNSGYVSTPGTFNSDAPLTPIIPTNFPSCSNISTIPSFNYTCDGKTPEKDFCNDKTDINDYTFIPSHFLDYDSPIQYPNDNYETLPSIGIDTENDSEDKNNLEYEEKDNPVSSSGPSVQGIVGNSFKCRKNCCPFCMTFQSHLNRHMVLKHKNESKVIEFMALPINSVERKKIHEELRVLGNFKHNSNVLKTKKGEIIPAVRPSAKHNYKDYIPCKNCNGFFNKAQMWRHIRNCKTKNSSSSSTSDYDTIIKYPNDNCESLPSVDIVMENDSEDENNSECEEKDDPIKYPIDNYKTPPSIDIDRDNDSECEKNGDPDSSSGPSVQSIFGNSFKCKKNCCPFCMTFQSHLNRHMTLKHKDESKVIEFMALPINSVERQKIHEELRILGNFKHNANVLKTKKGEIIPAVRPSSNHSYKDYIPCKNCYGFFTKSQLWRHNKKCKTKNKVHLSGRRVIGHGLNLLMNDEVSQSFKENILGAMVTNDINLIIRNDRLILSFGEKLYQQHPQLSSHRYIRNRMRELGRLLQEIRVVDSNVKSLRDAINPMKFEAVVEGTRRLSGFDGVSFEKASLVNKIGSHLKKCAEILCGIAMDKGEIEVLDNAENFIKRIEREWSSLSSLALRDMNNKKFNKPKYLPLIADLQVLNKFIAEETIHVYDEINKLVEDDALKNKENHVILLKLNWYYLSKLTISSIILFNKRRSADVSRILVKNFEEGMATTLVCEDLDTDKSYDNALAQYFHRLEITGKRGRGVRVMLSKLNVKCIKLLLSTRDSVGISKQNKYLFARPNNGSVNAISGSEALREIVNDAKLEKPETIFSTNIRRHIATLSQIINLEPTELEGLCSVLGHDIRVHADFCRLPNEDMQKSVMKLSFAFMSGNINEYENKKLLDITINEDELLPDLDDDVSSDDEDITNDKDSRSNDSDVIAAYGHGGGNDYDIQDYQNDEIRRIPGADARIPSKLPRRKWKRTERNHALKYFALHVRRQKLPGKAECVAFLMKYKIDRTWVQVKNFIRNYLTSIS